MIDWKDDDELFGIMRSVLYTAVVGDILDKMGYCHQFLPQTIRPMRDDFVLAGRAMTVLEADVAPDHTNGHNPMLKKSFGLMLEALDDLKKNEVYLCSGASLSYALIGEIMCTRMKYLGAAGAVANGFHRDTAGILKLDFPAFSCGAYAQDQAPRGKVVDYRIPIEVGGVKVNPGDIVMGDYDGVLVVPRELEREVITRAYEKATGEKRVGKEIKAGMSATEAFTKYGIM